MEKLGINLGYVLVQIIVFLLLFVVLRAWVFKPILGLLDRRREKLAQSLEDARVAAEARANAEKDAASITAEAQTKAAHIISEATERADSSMLELKAEADKEIAREREATLVEVEEERNRMLGELRGQVASLAIAAAHKLVGNALADEKKQHELLGEFFSGVKAGKTAVLDGSRLEGENAEVTSALPLTNEEQETVRKDLLGKLSPASQIEFKVDPNIMGGLVIRVGDQVLDGSVAGQLESFRQNLK